MKTDAEEILKIQRIKVFRENKSSISDRPIVIGDTFYHTTP